MSLIYKTSNPHQDELGCKAKNRLKDLLVELKSEPYGVKDDDCRLKIIDAIVPLLKSISADFIHLHKRDFVKTPIHIGIAIVVNVRTLQSKHEFIFLPHGLKDYDHEYVLNNYSFGL